MTRSTPAGDTDYELTGEGYETQRQADARIAAFLHARLGDARTVLNVGAGAGSYEPTDRQVIAVEPSARMRDRRRAAGLVPAVDASAEALPFDDDAVDAAMAVFTVHQWRDVAAGLRELRRVTRGPVVVMTLDVDKLASFWLSDYLPERQEAESRRFPAVRDVARLLGGDVRDEAVPIPHDCTDGFVEAYYARPEALLDPGVRAAQSAWGFVDPAVTEAGLARLAADLRSGEWDRRYGELRARPAYEGPLRLLTAVPSA
jgi:hypothetical protein